MALSRPVMALSRPVIASEAWQSSCCGPFGVLACLKRLCWIAASQAPRDDGMLGTASLHVMAQPLHIMALTCPVIASEAWQSSRCGPFGVLACLKRLCWIAASQAPRDDGMLGTAPLHVMAQPLHIMALTCPVIASEAWQSSCCGPFGVLACLKRLCWIAASQAPRDDGMLGTAPLHVMALPLHVMALTCPVIASEA
ncbi:hypothetical protein [Limnohabitans planktonicus]|nr:hypothetical protein [Limnohabitans planktonicus]